MPEAVPSPVGLDALHALNVTGRHYLGDLRTRMLEPKPHKVAPTFHSGLVADLCGIDTKQQIYLRSRAERGLPPGVPMPGGRRSYTLAEVRAWVKSLTKRPRRPEGAQAATLSVVNFKGGVAKTTTAVQLAQALTLLGRDVLVVDLDPQGSATAMAGWLPGTDVTENDTALRVFDPESRVQDLGYAVRASYWDGMDIVPAMPDLYSADAFLYRASTQGVAGWWSLLDRALQPLRSRYDYIIIDTAPSLSYMAVNAGIAADGLLMPLPPEMLDYASSVAYWGMQRDLLVTLRDLYGVAKEFDWVRVLLTKVDANNVASGIVRDLILQTYGGCVLPTDIPRSPVTSTSGLQFGTLYDTTATRYEGSARTYAKLRDASDAVALAIDNLTIATTWKGAQ
ncbi:AAA family ATPase [Azohydromonas aeria]|uniref:AAA family ATPase n=1 Tax=Azohydromonas aeria TaxID=2590212 RepID=UPI0012FB9B91|nr:AAA family ATPase [Azohydromonas aeria]